MCTHDAWSDLVVASYDDEAVRQFVHTTYDGRADSVCDASHAYRIARCDRCAACWQRDILNDHGMRALYELWINPTESLQKRRSPTLVIQYARQCARLLRLFHDPHDRRVLDYGMGWGEWLQMAAAFGFQACGVELSEERIALAKARGIAAYPPELLPAGPYDFIELEQVLEHVPSPLALLRNLSSRQNIGGYIHIGVPNGAGLERSAHHLPSVLALRAAQPLEHINIFTPHTLTSFMHRCGYVPAWQHDGLLRCDTIGHFLLDGIVTLGRCLPQRMTPARTNMLFRKKGQG